MNVSQSTLIITLSLAMTAALYASPASAANRSRSNYQNMGANCHAADPYDDYVRMERNATGYRNVSTSNNASVNTVIVCNYLTDIFSLSNPTGSTNTVENLYVYARAWRNRNVTLTCTATAGYATSPDNIVITKSVALLGTGVQNFIEFSSADNAGKNLPSPINAVCTVPGGVELNDAAVLYTDDVGL